MDYQNSFLESDLAEHRKVYSNLTSYEKQLLKEVYYCLNVNIYSDLQRMGDRIKDCRSPFVQDQQREYVRNNQTTTVLHSLEFDMRRGIELYEMEQHSQLVLEKSKEAAAWRLFQIGSSCAAVVYLIWCSISVQYTGLFSDAVLQIKLGDNIRTGVHLRNAIESIRRTLEKMTEARQLLYQAIRSALMAEGGDAQRLQTVGDALLRNLDHNIGVVDEWVQLLCARANAAADTNASEHGMELQPLLHGADNSV